MYHNRQKIDNLVTRTARSVYARHSNLVMPEPQDDSTVPKKPKRSGRQPAELRDDERTEAAPSALRIIGGEYRGRKLRYSGDPRTRPMKDRVREAVFNLLGPDVKGRHALDLFAGTGALGLEALSRGAARATFFEQHFPTAAIIRENVAALRLEDKADVIAANTFIQFRRELPASPSSVGPLPWVVFSSPPYDFYVERTAEMLKLLDTIIAAARPGSIIVVEADDRFDFGQLSDSSEWDLREYLPARVAIRRIM